MGDRPTVLARLARASVRRGAISLVILDVCRVAACFVIVLLLRFDGDVPPAHWERFGWFLPIIVAVHLVVSWRFGLYGQVWRHASVEEAVRVARASAVSLAVLLVVDMIQTPRVPISVVILGSVVTMVATGVSRFQSRLAGALNRSKPHVGVTPVAIVGSGDAAAMVIRSLRNDTSPAAMSPVAVLSDDPRELGHSLLGVPVVGGIECLPEIAERLKIAYALLAHTHPTRELTRRASAAAEAADIALKIVPDLAQLLGDARVARVMRDVRIEDLLGREQVRIDLDAVRTTIRGRRVLITGGGGSIGSEVVRQVAAFDPATLVIVDHDETHLFEVEATLGASCVQVLADIRDADVIDEIIQTHRPDVVFHAAAHKHVPLLESHPCEAVRTNVAGTMNVLRSAAALGVDRLVFVSTDKAVDPSSVMGASKWLGERLVRVFAPPGARWCAVRFGNVLGSRGSVIPTFTRQIEAGGPVTVTDPDMTRYFMSTQEAVQLVLQASALAKGTEIFMLEMGEPVNILGLAQTMIRLSGHVPGVDIPIEFTGPRPGEKMAEELAWREETALPTAHEAIQRLESAEVDAALLRNGVDKLIELARERDDDAVAALLLQLPNEAMMTSPRDEEPTWSPAST